MDAVNLQLLDAAKKVVRAVTVTEREDAFWDTWRAVKEADPSYMISMEEWINRVKD